MILDVLRLVRFTFLLLCCWTLSAFIANIQLFGQENPNFVIILADDMGFSDLGCTGGEIKTPNLDRLARNGVLFTNFYTTARCCPSRVALLTGQYQWDAGMGHMTYTNSPFKEYKTAMNRENMTIAELLGSSGYQTVMSGKWHVGDARDVWPDRRGFESFYGTPTGGGLYFYPSRFYKRPVFEEGKQVTPKKGWYSTDGFTDYAIEYLKSKRDKNQPFVMYLPYIAPHFPLQAKADDIAKYENTYDGGYKKIRKARFDKQKQLGIFENEDSFPASAYGDWSSVKNKTAEARKMEVYAAQVDCLDQNVGRLIATLEEEKLIDNTVIMFLSDNGGCSNRFNKTPKAKIGSAECNATYGRWFNVSNTPYRMAKKQVHEGGIISPLIVHWPKGIPKPSRYIRDTVHIMDILPTCLELTGTDYPESIAERKLSALDGLSFAKLFTKSESQPETSEAFRKRVLCWEHEGNRAIRQGNWKLVSLRNKPWELYELGKDPFEEQNLAGKKKETAGRLELLYKEWAKEHGVRKWPLKK